jgi:hypothetical protein
MVLSTGYLAPPHPALNIHSEGSTRSRVFVLACSALAILPVSLHLVEEIARQARARPPSLVHPHTSRRLHAKDAVLPVHIASHCNTTLALVGGRSATRGIGDRPATVLIGDIGRRLSGSGGIGVGRGEGGAAV